MRSRDAYSLHGEPAAYAFGARKVADGSVAYLQPNGGLGEANVGLIVAGGESLVIDTCWDHRQARRMLDAVAPWTDENPIRTVVNTHSNGDHWWGNALMPHDARIITSAASLAAMRNETPAALAALKLALKTASRLPLPGKLGRSVREGYREFSPFEFASVRRRYPDTMFSGSTTLSVGGRRVELREVGPAHTPGDLMVFDHGAGVVFTGDILFIGVTPIMWEGPAQNWIAALDAIVAFSPEAIVPGHGPLPSSNEVRDLERYFEWMVEQSARYHSKGVPASQAAWEMLSSHEFESNVWATWKRPESVVVGVATQYRHLEGNVGPLDQLTMARQLIAIRSLAERRARG